MTKKFKLFTGNRYKEVVEHVKRLDTSFTKDYLDSPYLFIHIEDKGYDFRMFIEIHRFYEDTEYKEITVDDFLELKPMEYVKGYRIIGTGDVEDGFKMCLTDPTFSVFTNRDYALAYANLPRLIYLRDKYDKEYKDGWKDMNDKSYYIIFYRDDHIGRARVGGFRTLLSFANKSARNKFYEDNMDLIIKCKAFLE